MLGQFHLQRAFSQKTFVLMRTSSRCLDQNEYIHLSLQDVFKIPLGDMFSKCLLDVLKTCPKTSSRHLQDVLPRRLGKMSSKHLQNVFKMYHQVKLLLLTLPEDIFEKYSTRFRDTLGRRLSTEIFALVTLLRNL